MFSSSLINSSLVRCLRSSIPGEEVLLPIIGNMQNLLQSRALRVVIDHAVGEHDHACFQCWFMRGVHAVVHHSNCDNPVKRANCLLNLFFLLVAWHLNTRAYISCLTVLCCIICVIDKLMLTHGMHELEPRAKIPLRLITLHSAQNSDHLSCMVQFISGLTERCSQRHLYTVAECLVQLRQ